MPTSVRQTDATGPTEIPRELPKLNFELAAADPFASVVVPAPEPPAPPVQRAKANEPRLPEPATFVPPQPPALQVRLLGTMLTPAGNQIVYLTRGDKEFAVKTGDHLDEGYIVESVDREKVTLLYPPTESRVLLPILKAPGVE